ncbi:MAG: U32 family peptidase [Bacilli bacterium]
MKLISEVKNINNIEQYNLDGIIISYKPFSTTSDLYVDYEDIVQINDYCHRNDKLSILKIDKIIEEKEVDELYEFLDSVHPLSIDYYIFSDMSVLSYFKTKNELDKLIFSAKTLSCSYNDVLFYQQKGIKVIISNELTLESIIKISELENVVIDGYGYSNIFYSKRKLLSLFKEAKNLSEDVKNEILYIREETRKENQPIIENENGTFIYTSSKYLFFKEIEKLHNLFMFKIESLMIQEEELIKIINIYNKGLKGDLSDENYLELVKIDNDVTTSFLYKKPKILKEKSNE